MATFKQYTFENVSSNHTITAEFEADSPTPPGPTPVPAGSMRMFYKQNGVWKPLFTEN